MTMKFTLAIIITIALAAPALSQSRTFYDSAGRVTGKSTTDSAGTTTFYDASGRVTGRSSKDSGGTTTIYDASGRNIGRFTTSC